MTVYLKLMHGRDAPDQQMNDWGFNGPVLGPFEAVHFTYTTHVRCFPKGSSGDAEAIELCFHDDMLVYEGKFYGDFEIAAAFGSTTPEPKLPPGPEGMNEATMSNFLDIRCPKCRGTNQIDIAATVWLRVTEDGTDADESEDGNHEFEPTSPAICNTCGFTGRVQDFEQQD